MVEVGLDGSRAPLPLAPGDVELPRYSPDGRRVAYESEDAVRVFDLAGASLPATSRH